MCSSDLYDMASDPSEKKNVAGEHPEIVSALAERLQKIIAGGRSTIGTPQKNDAEMTLDYLPVR